MLFAVSLPNSFMNTEAEAMYCVSRPPYTEPHFLSDFPDRSQTLLLALPSSMHTKNSLAERVHPFLGLLLLYLC